MKTGLLINWLRTIPLSPTDSLWGRVPKAQGIYQERVQGTKEGDKMKTREAIDRLNESQKTWLETMNKVIVITGESGKEELNRECRHKLRGFVECLQMSGIVDNFGMKGLYLYYTMEHAEKK